MREGVELKERRRRKTCQHRWMIETPHGATSRGRCKRCGAMKRFPNAPEAAPWEPASGMGRWSSRGGVARPSQVKRTGNP